MVELTILCAAYSISLFYRGMLAVIAPELNLELGLSEAQFGILASTFSISFAAAQIPSGIALDRFGGRITLIFFLCFAMAGTLLLSVVKSFYPALMAQALIGIGCAPLFTGTMLFIGRRFPPQKFAFITALVIAVGSVGDMLGTTPLAFLAEAVGWRRSMWLIAFIAALIALCCMLGLSQDKPEGQGESVTEMLQGMFYITRVRVLWPLLPMFLASYAVLMAIRGTWSGPYLAELFQADTSERGYVLLTMSVSMALGTFLLGTLDRYLKSTKTVVICSAVLMLMPLLILAIFPAEGIGLALLCFIALGLFGFNYPLLMSHARTFLAPGFMGRGMALLTSASFIGVALVQATSGWLLAEANRALLVPEEQYRLLFILLSAVLVPAILAYCFSISRGRADQPEVGVLTRRNKAITRG